MNAKSIKFFFRTLLLMMVSLSAGAASLSPEQALQRVESSNTRLRIPGNNRFTLEFTENSHGENVLYVFNKGNDGFIIASADDCMPPLLGYSDKGSFDMENASPEFKWWLSEYASELDAFFNSDASRNYVYTATRSDRATIPPLLATEWNQGYPYNLYCPYDAGGQSVTGCVATAMAQVIKYHGYPSSGTGSHSYSWKGQTLEFNYADANFDYGNMLDVYYDNSDQAQKEAVANLMYACGVGVDMDYSSRESGASDMIVLKALKDYFNYDPDMRSLAREYYSNEEWNEIVYSELNDRRPVLYRGSSDEGGHMFVCDGYEDGYFHINWGWGGYCDGWFLLSALNPDGQGIGGYEGGYNSYQRIVCGVQPYSDAPQTTYPIFASSGFEVTNVVGNSYIELFFQDNGGVFNYSPNEINTTFYLKAVSSGGEEFLSEGIDLSFPACDFTNWGYLGISLYLPSVGEGEYKVYVMFDGPQGQLQQLAVPLTYKDYMNMKVDAEGNVSFYNDDSERAEIFVTQLSPVSEVMARRPVDFNLSVRNDGKVGYSGTVYVRCFNPGSQEAVSEQAVQVSVRGGETLNETVNMVFDVQPGEYELRCYDMFGELCSDNIKLTVVENPEVVKIVVTQFEQEGEVVSGQPAIFDISMKNEGNVEYDGYFSVKTYNPGSDSPVYTYNIGITLKPGQVFNGWVELTYDLPDGEYEQRCFDMFGNPCSETFTLVVGERAEEPEIVVTDFTPMSQIYEGTPAQFNLSYKNEGSVDYSGELYILTYRSGSDDPVSQHLLDVYFKAGSSSSFGVELDYDLPAGDYEIQCFDKFGNACSALFPFTIKDKSESPTVFVSQLSQISDVIANEDAEFNFSIQNIGIVNYNGPLFILTYNHDSDEPVYQNAFGVNIDPEVSYSFNITMKYDLPDGDYEQQCFDMFWRPCSDVFPLTIGKRPDVVATGISLDKTEATLTEGETLTLTATVDPENASDRTVTWTTSDAAIATVENGVVKAVAPGTAVITASTANGLTATCTVTVNAKVIDVTGISLDKTEATLTEGETLTLTATVDPENASDRTVTWTTSDAGVATVENGVVKAVAPGTAVITASTANGLTATCTVTVNAKVIDVTGISLDKTEATLTEGETLTLTATVDPENASDRTVTWTTSDATVATVENGVVVAVAPGTAVITASTANGLTATCTVTVNAKVIDVTGISLDKTEATLTEGETLTLTATVDPENASDRTVTWTTSDAGVATVENGVVKAVAPGTAVITASTANGLTATCTVTVNAKVIDVTGISLDKTEATLTEGETLTLTATVDPENASDRTVTWTTSDSAVATVENGVVKAVAPGTAVITASTSNGLTAQCMVTVEQKIVYATSITLDITAIEAEIGSSFTIVATVLPYDTTDKTVAWSSSDESVAVVDQNGNVTVVAMGGAVITAVTTDGSDLTAQCAVNGIMSVPSLISSGNVDIYTFDGILLRKNVDAEFIDTLSKGTYIIRAFDRSYKIIKR